MVITGPLLNANYQYSKIYLSDILNMLKYQRGVGQMDAKKEFHTGKRLIMANKFNSALKHF